MSPAGAQSLWLAAAVLLAVAIGGGGAGERTFTAAARDRDLDLRLNLNEADRAELESLPGIGPALAIRIEEHRRRKGFFQDVDSLGEVRGIGAVRAAVLAPFLTVEGERALSATGE